LSFYSSPIDGDVTILQALDGSIVSRIAKIDIKTTTHDNPTYLVIVYLPSTLICFDDLLKGIDKMNSDLSHDQKEYVQQVVDIMSTLFIDTLSGALRGQFHNPDSLISYVNTSINLIKELQNTKGGEFAKFETIKKCGDYFEKNSQFKLCELREKFRTCVQSSPFEKWDRSKESCWDNVFKPSS
jgi:hypothetical protein